MAEIKMYTADWCGWCQRAKRLLSHHGYSEITEIDIDQWDPDRDQLENLTGQRTVPQIYIGSEYVGGFPELVDLIKQDGLHTLAQA